MRRKAFSDVLVMVSRHEHDIPEGKEQNSYELVDRTAGNAPVMKNPPSVFISTFSVAPLNSINVGSGELASSTRVNTLMVV